jgi:hypothetical protein
MEMYLECKTNRDFHEHDLSIQHLYTQDNMSMFSGQLWPTPPPPPPPPPPPQAKRATFATENNIVLTHSLN